MTRAQRCLWTGPASNDRPGTAATLHTPRSDTSLPHTRVKCLFANYSSDCFTCTPCIRLFFFHSTARYYRFHHNVKLEYQQNATKQKSSLCPAVAWSPHDAKATCNTPSHRSIKTVHVAAVPGHVGGMAVRGRVSGRGPARRTRPRQPAVDGVAEATGRIAPTGAYRSACPGTKVAAVQAV